MKFFIALFSLSLAGQFLIPLFLPQLKILGFLPYIIFAISRLSLPKVLWCSSLSGLIIDLYSFGPPLGFFAINYALASLILFQYKKFFSEENLPSFVLLATLFSFLSTLIHFFLYGVIDTHLKLSFLTLGTDLICMPLIDGAYTLVWALFPLLLYKYLTEPSRMLYYKTKLELIINGLSRITRS
jgi:hypothetical protein